ncbi:MAG: hypothetical protein GC152_09615 [Alphaproteobacteria bacterium]|nr:hypothetical protein [Alphaproteobacteria bacterium]
MPKIPFFNKKDDESGDPLQSLVLKERLRVLKKTNITETGPLEGVVRSDKRLKTHKVGEILLADGKTISCLVHDFSDTGMRLEIREDGATPPDGFRLRVPTLQFDRRVIVVWRSANSVGVSYTE